MVKIKFLGTSAQMPTVKRNHTGILLSYKDENILIDCGEGIQRQMRIGRLNPCKITRILITHSHGDHVFGLPGLLSTLSVSEYPKTLYIYGPRGFSKFMKKFLDLFKLGNKMDIVVKETSGVFFENDDFYLESEVMEHGIPTNAYSFVVKDKLRIDKKKLEDLRIPKSPLLKDLKAGKDIVIDSKKVKSKDLTYLEKGKKISVVLDTLYNDRIDKFVKDADLLISESSFGGDLKDLAKEHSHLDSEQVGKIAKKAKVKKLLLTHISQRYDNKLKDLLGYAKKNFEDVKIVKDFDEFEI